MMIMLFSVRGRDNNTAIWEVDANFVVFEAGPGGPFAGTVSLFQSMPAISVDGRCATVEPKTRGLTLTRLNRWPQRYS